MNENENKRTAKDFIERLIAKCKDAESSESALRELKSEPAEYRVSIAMGLVAIGFDRSENILYRNVMLGQLAMLVRACGLHNNKDLERQLSQLIDEWLTTVSDRDLYAGPWGALVALGSVNRSAGLEKCDHVIKFYGESEAGRHVREIRKNIERLNALEP